MKMKSLLQKEGGLGIFFFSVSCFVSHFVFVFIQNIHGMVDDQETKGAIVISRLPGENRIGFGSLK